MPEGAAIGVLLGLLVLAVVVETFIGAVCLRAGVALHNKVALFNQWAGGASTASSVPEPALGKAMGITFATSLARIIVASLFGIGTGGTRGQAVDAAAVLISIPVSLLIMAEMLSARLPTTFGRAILVVLCYLIVVLLVGGGLVGIAVLVFGVALRGA
jgi:hypothetical protein